MNEVILSMENVGGKDHVIVKVSSIHVMNHSGSFEDGMLNADICVHLSDWRSINERVEKCAKALGL